MPEHQQLQKEQQYFAFAWIQKHWPARAIYIPYSALERPELVDVIGSLRSVGEPVGPAGRVCFESGEPRRSDQQQRALSTLSRWADAEYNLFHLNRNEQSRTETQDDNQPEPANEALPPSPRPEATDPLGAEQESRATEPESPVPAQPLYPWVPLAKWSYGGPPSFQRALSELQMDNQVVEFFILTEVDPNAKPIYSLRFFWTTKTRVDNLHQRIGAAMAQNRLINMVLHVEENQRSGFGFVQTTEGEIYDKFNENAVLILSPGIKIIFD